MARRRRGASYAAPLDEIDAAAELISKGWAELKNGKFRHPCLEGGEWPVMDAHLLQWEADQGRQDLVHRTLRGEL